MTFVILAIVALAIYATEQVAVRKDVGRGQELAKTFAATLRPENF
jgi:hypothetical protein